MAGLTIISSSSQAGKVYVDSAGSYGLLIALQPDEMRYIASRRGFRFLIMEIRKDSKIRHTSPLTALLAHPQNCSSSVVDELSEKWKNSLRRCMDRLLSFIIVRLPILLVVYILNMQSHQLSSYEWNSMSFHSLLPIQDLLELGVSADYVHLWRGIGGQDLWARGHVWGSRLPPLHPRERH